MSTNSNIEWTDVTWNPLAGCSPVSPGCLHCYAAVMAYRLEKMGQEKYQGLTVLRHGVRTFNGTVRTDEAALTLPLSWKKPRRVFVNSMSDLFHEAVPFEFVDRVFAVMASCSQHTFQVLTKRPERMAEYLAADRVAHRIAKAMDSLTVAMEIAALKEAWLPVAGRIGYEVSNLGQVRGPRGILNGEAGEQGHTRVTMHGGDRTRELVHRLVLTAFDRAPVAGEQGRHRNGDAGCNALPNLLWGTQSDNWDDRIRHGDYRSYSKLTPDQAEEIKQKLVAGHPTKALAEQFGVSDTQIRNIGKGDQWATEGELLWPLGNCWLGTSVEDQKRANERIPWLLKCSAKVRFISAEPLLGPLNLDKYLWTHGEGCTGEALDWVIAGGESGPGARPCDVDWVRSLVRQCREAGVACFVKQLGLHSSNLPGCDNPCVGMGRGHYLCDCGDMKHGQVIETAMKDPKGGDMAEWPEDLRVREMPGAAGGIHHRGTEGTETTAGGGA